MVLVWTIGDVRYRFRIQTAPLSLYRLTFNVMVVLGILTLLTDLWRSEQWLVPYGNILTPSGWQAILGSIFLLTFLSWSWFAFIKPPVYGKRNARRYAEALYQIILKGSPQELSIVADEFSRSVQPLLHFAPNKEKLRNINTSIENNTLQTDLPDVVICANRILLLIADKKFCQAIVESSPGTAWAIFNEMVETKKYDISIEILFKNIINEALTNKDSFLFHETNLYDTGFIGHLKPISSVMFSNYEMVEEIGIFSNWGRYDSKQWDASQLQAFCRIVLMALNSYIENGKWKHSYTLFNALNTIGHATFDLYFYESEKTQIYDAQNKLHIIVEFIKEAVNSLDETHTVQPTKVQHITPNRIDRKSIYDHLAETIVTIIASASGVKSPIGLCWSIQYRHVWGELFGLTGLNGNAGEIVKFKVRRLIYNEVTNLKTCPNFKSARILGFCLNVMGFEIRDQNNHDYKALHKAILSWTKKNYSWLYFSNLGMAKECLVDSITYDAERLRLAKTWPAEGTRPKPKSLYFYVNPPPQNIE